MSKKEKWISRFEEAKMVRSRGIKEYAMAFGMREDQLKKEVARRRVTVDLGCGQGRFVREMGAGLVSTGLGAKVIGIDYLAEQSRGDCWEIRPGKFDRLPLADGEADLVVSVAGFGLYAKDESDLGSQVVEVRRCLKSGGEAWVVVCPYGVGIEPRRYWLEDDDVPQEELIYDRRALACEEIELYRPKHYGKINHPKLLSRASLSCFRNRGFEIIARHRVDDTSSTLGMVAIRLKKV